MSKIEENLDIISKLPFAKTLFIIQTVIYCLAIPLTAIFFYFNTLFNTLENIKMIALSICLGSTAYATIYSVSAIIVFVLIAKYKPKTERIFEITSLIVNSALSLSLFICWITYLLVDFVVPFKILLSMLYTIPIVTSVGFGLGYNRGARGD